MTKWLSDEEIEEHRHLTRACLPVFGDKAPTLVVFDQAKEANRLREGLEELAEQMRSDITDMRSNSLGADPGEEVAAGMCEDFVERIRELLERND